MKLPAILKKKTKKKCYNTMIIIPLLNNVCAIIVNLIVICFIIFRVFEEAVRYCDEFIKLIPLTFILGFYVAYVAARWWQQYEAIPWPDK